MEAYLCGAAMAWNPDPPDLLKGKMNTCALSPECFPFLNATNDVDDPSCCFCSYLTTSSGVDTGLCDGFGEPGTVPAIASDDIRWKDRISGRRESLGWENELRLRPRTVLYFGCAHPIGTRYCLVGMVASSGEE